MTISEHVGVLLHKVDLNITNYLKKELIPYQLAPEQHLLMALLLESEGLSQSEISETLQKDKSSVTRMIVSLEKKGYIHRAISKMDRRSVEVYLTEEGRDLEEVINRVSKNTKALLEGSFEENELTELKRLLMKVQSNLDAYMK